MSDESIKLFSTSNKMINPSVNYVGTKARVNFNGYCLKQEKNFIWSWKNSKHLHCLWNWRYSTLENCFFAAVKLTWNVDTDLYEYSGYSSGFDRKRFVQLVMKLVEM